MTTGSGIADRRREQALRVGGRRRDRDLDARRVHVVRLGRVVVQLGRAHAAAVRHAHDERELHAAAGAPAVAADVRDQLVEARIRRTRRTASRRPAASRPCRARRRRRASPPRRAACRRSGRRRSARCSPAVARKTPPARPTSSPITSTESSRASSVWKQSLIASIIRSSAKVASEDPPELGEVLRERRGRVRVRVLEHEPDVGLRLGLRLGDALRASRRAPPP